MAIEKVKAYFADFGIADRVQEFEVSSATVELAALPFGQQCLADKGSAATISEKVIEC